MIIMENKRQFCFLRFIFRCLYPLFFLFFGFLYAETPSAEIIEVEGSPFIITRGGTDLNFPSGGKTRVELLAGDVVKTLSGGKLVIEGSSGLRIQLAENSAFFLRPEGYPSPSKPENLSASIGTANAGENMFSGELFYGRMRISASGEAAPSVISVSSFSVFPGVGSDFGCDILYVQPESEGRFPSVNRVSCFTGSVTVVQGGPSPAYSSPVILNEGDMITEGIPGSSVTQVFTALAPVSQEILDFWDISGKEAAEPVIVAEIPVTEPVEPAPGIQEQQTEEFSLPVKEKETPSLQEKILPEEPMKRTFSLNKQTMRTVSGIMFLSGFVMTGVTMYFYLNDWSPKLVEPLGVTSGVLIGSSLIPAFFSLFVD